MLIATLWHALVMLLFHGMKSNQKFLCRAQDSGAFRHAFAANRSYVGVL